MAYQHTSLKGIVEDIANDVYTIGGGMTAISTGAMVCAATIKAGKIIAKRNVEARWINNAVMQIEEDYMAKFLSMMDEAARCAINFETIRPIDDGATADYQKESLKRRVNLLHVDNDIHSKAISMLLDLKLTLQGLCRSCIAEEAMDVMNAFILLKTALQLSHASIYFNQHAEYHLNNKHGDYPIPLIEIDGICIDIDADIKYLKERIAQ